MCWRSRCTGNGDVSVIDCIPDNTGVRCVYCGWEWTRLDICAWPRRNCPASPDLLPAAQRLGLTLLLPAFTRRLAEWLAVGMPERSADEQARIASICRACKQYGPATDEPGMGFEVCLCGCAGVWRANRPPLGAVWKMAGGRCLDDKVKAW